MSARDLPVVVIGAGPVGLSAAVQLLDRKIEVVVLEAADEIGASQRAWGHVRLFSPWRYDVDKTAVRYLEATGWGPPPPDEMPTGDDLYRRYLLPLANLPQLSDRIFVNRRVLGITRVGVDKTRTDGRGDVPFLVRTEDEDIIARAVIDASGTWWTPNPLGAAGLPARGEKALKHRVHYGIPDVLGAQRHRYAGRTTMVVGAGHSAANSILPLMELAKTSPGTTVFWATRSSDLSRVFGGGDADGLPARGKLGAELRALAESGALRLVTRFRIESLREIDGKVEVAGTRDGEPAVVQGLDAIIAATGQRPDLSIDRELRIGIDTALDSVEALAPLIDPNVHSCGSVRPHGAVELAHPEPDFYIIGSKSYGRAPTFLLATGYEQARSVAAMIAGDREAALRVELDLPETGVCKSNLVVDDDGGGCCTPAKSACC
ncbi:MAG: NAD(P)/FAD-dependent oxidoreductase [Kofleriaceae bacterium]|nr:MAG: NAD(P)/FAD-dependent oxidoreductase [Kofleriaceae bacterium]MBZ0231050.1 FAD-dependent oxidoreductase [Kofleriaceae bacterium]